MDQQQNNSSTSKDMLVLYRWMIGVLMTVCSFFCIGIYNKIDAMQEDLTKLLIQDGIKNQQLLQLEKRLQIVENGNPKN